MQNRLKAYVRRTLLLAARDYSTKTRRTPESTRSAMMDATRGTDTGWWTDLIYTAPMLKMAHTYRNDIVKALDEYQQETGEDYCHREYGSDKTVTASRIIYTLFCKNKPYTLEQFHMDPRADDALLGLRFAVEWYASDIARELCPDL